MSDADISSIEDAIEAGIDAASEYVSALPSSGQKAWDVKEFKIAEIAARKAIEAWREMTR